MLRKTLAIAAISFAMANATAHAQYLNLTGAPNNGTSPVTTGTGTAAIGGTFRADVDTTQPTGTGVFEPFLTIKQTGQESGFNTDIGSPLDDLRSPSQWVSAIQLSDVTPVTLSGVSYYAFKVDVNQSANGPISLNQVQLFTSATDLGASGALGYSVDSDPSTQPPVISFTAANTERFRLNDQLGAFNEIGIDSARGSGSGDAVLYIPTLAFAGALPTDYVTLYAQFGNPPGFDASSAGFEEFSGFTQGGIVPEPASIVMAFLGPLPLGLWALRRRKLVTA